MDRLLSGVARRSARFQPQDVADVFAIVIARLLSDPHGITYYRDVSHQYPLAKLAFAVHAALSGKSSVANPRMSVEVTLSANVPWQARSDQLTIGLIIERRFLGAGVFRGARLVDALCRHIPSSKTGAETATATAISWLAEQYPEATVGLQIQDVADTRRAELSELAKSLMRTRGTPLWELTNTEVRETYGVPDAPDRQACRDVGAELWPSLVSTAHSDCLVDAALLGFAVQVRKCLAAGGDVGTIGSS